MKRIAIIGGGISGLSAAFALEKKRRAGTPLEYVVFEASSRLGGVLHTEHVDGCVVEAGPDSFVTEKPWAADLCRELGLADQLIGSNDAERKTYIVVKGKLVEMPDGLMFMVPTKVLPTVLSPLFSFSTKLHMAREWFHPPRKADADESVASFVQRHYGAEMVDRLADPLLSGIYGGEARQLSVRAAVPRFAEMEAKYGSLGRAMLAARKAMSASSQQPARPLFTSLKNGMQQMTDALVSVLPGSAQHSGRPVESLQYRDGSWLVRAAAEEYAAAAVIVAAPAASAAALLARISPELASELRQINYSSSITVVLGYDHRVRAELPSGFGFLVPRTESKRLLAATFVHNKFPHRAPENRALIRCFLAGDTADRLLEQPQADIAGIARAELSQMIGLDAQPLFTRVYKWKRAMAQYGVGHLDRLQRIEALCRLIPGLTLAGNAYRGIGVPDCVRSGQSAAEEVLAQLGVSPHAEAIRTGDGADTKRARTVLDVG